MFVQLVLVLRGKVREVQVEYAVGGLAADRVALVLGRLEDLRAAEQGLRAAGTEGGLVVCICFWSVVGFLVAGLTC